MMIGQLQQQQIANQVIILQAQQQFHSTEITRMDTILERLEGSHDKAELFNNCVSKKNDHIAALKNIHKKITEIG